MRHIKASDFKAKCLELLDSVHMTGESVTVTRKGVPLAKLTPIHKSTPLKFGMMKGQFKITGDIVGPEPDAWNLDRVPGPKRAPSGATVMARRTAPRPARTK